jgi:hypothetical protein
LPSRQQHDARKTNGNAESQFTHFQNNWQHKPTNCLDRIQGRSYAAQEKANRFLCASGGSYRGFLETERQGGWTRSIKKQQEGTALRRKKGFLRAGSEDVLRNNIKQFGFGDEASKRTGYSHAQCKNDQSVLRIIPALNRVIPTVKQFEERTK